MKYRKSKYNSRLKHDHLNAVLRISTSKIKHNINKLFDAIQTQKSHKLLLCIYFYNII